MVGPVPGMSEQRLPTIVPRHIGKKACFNSPLVGRMSLRPTLVYLVLIGATWLTLFMNSAMPNKPSANAMSSMPSSSSVMPNV